MIVDEHWNMLMRLHILTKITPENKTKNKKFLKTINFTIHGNQNFQWGLENKNKMQKIGLVVPSWERKFIFDHNYLYYLGTNTFGHESYNLTAYNYGKTML